MASEAEFELLPPLLDVAGPFGDSGGHEDNDGTIGSAGGSTEDDDDDSDGSLCAEDVGLLADAVSALPDAGAPSCGEKRKRSASEARSGLLRDQFDRVPFPEKTVRPMNPATGEMWRRGDVNAEGRIFFHYEKAHTLWAHNQEAIEFYREYKSGLETKRRKSNSIDYRASVLINGARKRAKKPRRGGAVTIDLEWTKEKLRGGICEVTGLQLDMNSKRGALAPSIDRIDSKNKDYSPENSRIVAYQVNVALNSFSLKDSLVVFEALATAARQANGIPEPSSSGSASLEGSPAGAILEGSPAGVTGSPTGPDAILAALTAARSRVSALEAELIASVEAERASAATATAGAIASAVTSAIAEAQAEAALAASAAATAAAARSASKIQADLNSWLKR